MSSLKEKTASGLFWAAMNNGSMQILNAIIGIFLARLLSPADYGLVGMVAIFTAIAPPGADHIWLTVGSLAFGITVISALAALSARETFRIHMNDLGQPDAAPVAKPEYDRLRAAAVRGAVA